MENCLHCGRPVKPTVHRREGKNLFEVDYFRMLTGELSRVVMQKQDDESAKVEFYKLTMPRFVITCADCMKQARVRDELERLFSGVPEAEENGQAQSG